MIDLVCFVLISSHPASRGEGSVLIIPVLVYVNERIVGWVCEGR